MSRNSIQCWRIRNGRATFGRVTDENTQPTAGDMREVNLVKDGCASCHNYRREGSNTINPNLHSCEVANPMNVHQLLWKLKEQVLLKVENTRPASMHANLLRIPPKQVVTKIRSPGECYVLFCRQKGTRFTEWNEAMITRVKPDWGEKIRKIEHKRNLRRTQKINFSSKLDLFGGYFQRGHQIIRQA